jgi:hypothetical protein
MSLKIIHLVRLWAFTGRAQVGFSGSSIGFLFSSYCTIHIVSGFCCAPEYA